MPIRVQVPGHGIVEFPDGTSQEDMSKTLVSLPAAPAAPAATPARTWTDTAVDLLPSAGGLAGGIMGGIGGTVAGMGVGGVPGAVGGAALGGGAGEATRQLINRARGVDTPQTSADAAKGIGVQGAIQGGAQAVGAGLGAVASRLAPAMMQSALKPGIQTTLAAVKSGKVPPVVKTLLDEGINVTPGGIEKLNGIISATNAEIKAALASLPQGSMAVSAKDVASRLAGTAARFANQVNPVGDLSAITDAGQEFVAAHGPYMTLPDAQAVKQGTYAALKSKAYGEVKEASIEAQKALARGLKEEIAAEAERSGLDLSSLNGREGKALDALQAVAKRVAVGGNANPLGLAGIAASHPATFITMLLDKSPAVKSMLARGLYQSAGYVTGVAPQVIRAAVVALTQQQPDKEQP